MKTRILSLLAATLALTGCLSENPKDPTNPDAVYGSASALYVNAVASLYTHIGSSKESEGLQGTCYGIFDYNELSTDEAIIPIRGGDWYDGGFWQNLYNHKWTASDNELYKTWTYLFKVIMLCNQSLETIDKYKSVLTATELAEYRAEVRALRAMFYFYAMDMFGRVPLVTSAAVNVDDVAQKERSETYRFIVSELQEVLPNLPDKRSNETGNYYGRLTRPVAHFLLAKLALNAEIYSDDDWTDGTQPDGKNIFFTVEGDQKNAWETCAYYCNQLTLSDYVLQGNYADNFILNNETSLENIFTIPMDRNYYASQYHYLFRSLHYKHGAALSRKTENGLCATRTTVLAYGYGSDRPDTRLKKNLYVDTVWVNNQKVTLDNGDPLVYYPLAVEVNLTNSPYIRTAGARIAKYEIDPSNYEDGKLQDNDIVLFRYADVLLMRAEALVRNSESGLSALNAVRMRSGQSRLDATLDNILDERLRELFFEGWRRQDLIRFGRFHKSYDLREANDDEADAHTTVFPIPQKSLELNTHLKQNKGY